MSPRRAILSLLLVAVSDAAPTERSFLKSISDKKVLQLRRENRRKLGSDLGDLLAEAQREEPKERVTDQFQSCDSAFLSCYGDRKCNACYSSLEENGINWAAVDPETPCKGVIDMLVNKGHCADLKDDSIATDIFCKTFNACVAIQTDDADRKKKKKTDVPAAAKNKTACDDLVECDWPGMRKGFIGDGTCQDFGCYNHRICNYDGGDCCQDTCVNWNVDDDDADENEDEDEDGEAGTKVCGSDGFKCRDPRSKFCDSSITKTCPKPADEPDDTKKKECRPDETLYRIEMYDSFGDGWDGTQIELMTSNGTVVFKGGLAEGAQSTTYVCLSTKATCYNVELNGGVWGKEISWEIKPLLAGARSVAEGGAPMKCTFTVGGNACETTCEGMPENAQNDKDYVSYKKLSTCMKEKCFIQRESCEADSSCVPCLAEQVPQYCYANKNFNFLVDCSLCYCMEDGESHCGSIFFDDDFEDDSEEEEEIMDDIAFPETCTADETLKGSAAVMLFAKCSEFSKVGLMVNEYDINNFGALDTFQECARSYRKSDLHGGKTALECMRIITNAIAGLSNWDSISKDQLEAIRELAELLYKQGENFCNCALVANSGTPACESFSNFKNILFESLNACQALDDIDCDAWAEFSPRCQDNLKAVFPNGLDLKNNPKQCGFILDQCGGVGPFPAFRRLDCASEIKQEEWDFYLKIKEECLGGGDEPAPASVPVPAPKPPPPLGPAPGVPGTNTPAPVPAYPTDSGVPDPTQPPIVNPKPYFPSGGAKPYVPSDSKSSSSSKPKKKRHLFLWFLVICALGGGGYYYYKRQTDSFDFYRYRRARNWGGDSDFGVSGGFSYENATSSFEPPSLPPTPSAIMDQMS